MRQWIAEQGLERYNKGNDAMIEVISAKQQHLSGPVEGELARKLFLALYDLDGFRGTLSGSVAADCRRLGLEAGPMLSGDDSVLLGFAVAYAAEMLRHFPDSGKKQNKSSGDAGSWN